MSKKRKPGQIAKVTGKMLRCKKREYGCNGCVLNGWCHIYITKVKFIFTYFIFEAETTGL